MWKIINKTRVRSIADLTANGVWLINYTYSRYCSKCLKFQSNPSDPSAQGRLEPKGTVPSLLQPPLHTQDLPPYLKNQRVPFPANSIQGLKTHLSLVKCRKTKGGIL